MFTEKSMFHLRTVLVAIALQFAVLSFKVPGEEENSQILDSESTAEPHTQPQKTLFVS